jgi:hypothetical protein
MSRKTRDVSFRTRCEQIMNAILALKHSLKRFVLEKRFGSGRFCFLDFILVYNTICTMEYPSFMLIAMILILLALYKEKFCH